MWWIHGAVTLTRNMLGSWRSNLNSATRTKDGENSRHSGNKEYRQQRLQKKEVY